MRIDIIIDIQSVGKDKFKTVLNLFNSKIEGYLQDDEKGLILFAYIPNSNDEINKLPYNMTMNQAVDFLYGWLEQCTYPPEPDHDGSNEKGWRIYNNNNWKRVDNNYGFSYSTNLDHVWKIIKWKNYLVIL